MIIRLSSAFAPLFAVALFAGSAPAAAQYGNDSGRTIRCDSNDGRMQTCSADTRGGVRLVRQYSKSACVEGRSWGSNRSGVWVAQGCRAEFALGSGGGNNGGQWGGNNGNNGSAGNSVRCDSNDNRYRQCSIDGGRVYLERQYSKSACIEGQTWGSGRGYVWVNNGCRGQFASGRGGGQWGGGGGWNGGRPGNGWAEPQRLYCGSDDSRPRRCNVTVRRDARMVQQKSKAACIEGHSWGWDRSGVWVSNGCRADFQVY